MKRGNIVKRRRFVNKYGHKILNITLALAVFAFVGTIFSTTIGGNNGRAALAGIAKENIVKADTMEDGIKIVEVIGYNDNEVLLKDGTKYYKENAKEIIENNTTNGVVISAIIVNGKCTDLMFDISYVNN